MTKAGGVEWSSYGEMEIIYPCRNVNWIWKTGKITSDTKSETIQRRASSFLAKLTGSEAKNETIDHDAA
jgi:hypothetical protein